MKTRILLILTVLLFMVGTGWTIGDVDRVEDYIDTEIATIDGEVGVIDGIVDDLLEYQVNPYLLTNFLSVTIDHSHADWDDQATNEVFDITGNIEFWLVVYDSLDMDVTNASDSLRILLGTSLLWSCLAEGWDAGEFIPFGTANADGPTLTLAKDNAIDSNIGTVRFHGYSFGLDIGYEHVTAVATSGFTRWLIWWKDLDATGDVIAGTGGTL